MTWMLFGRPSRPTREESDPLLDRFIPRYEIREHHHIRVKAPAAVTLEAASQGEMFDTPLIRAIFKARELLLGTEPDTRERPKGLVAAMRSIGWGLLAEVAGREIVMGAVTKPWEANVVFRPIPPDRFAAFAEPGYVKIAWTLRADPVDDTHSVFRTETRASSTDPASRERFRRYWALVSPGIVAIRWLGLQPTRRAAERAARRTVAT
ncbi:MAG: hypothetical protein AB7P99_02250 [Vicinamibacterales bacterium]